jgi:hypothetical protein
MLAPGAELNSFADGIVPTETTIRLRVHMPYKKKTITGENAGVN